MQIVLYTMILISLSLNLSAFTDKELREINKAFHDADVKMKKENEARRIAQRCQNGYYYNNYGAGKHFQMCGGAYTQEVPSMPILFSH